VTEDQNGPDRRRVAAMLLHFVFTAVRVLAVLGASFLSFLLFLVVAADAKPGTHPDRPVGQFLLASLAAWGLVFVLNRWSRRKV